MNDRPHPPDLRDEEDPDNTTSVLHLVWRLSRSGGIPVVVRSLLLALDGKRVHTSVATVRPLRSEDGIEHVVGLHSFHPLDHEGALTAPAAVRIAFRFGLLACRHRPDVIHAHSGTGVLTVGAALLSMRSKRTLDVHDAPGNGRHSRLTESIEGTLVRHFGYVAVVHSTSVRTEISEAWRLEPARVRIVPLGIATDELVGTPERRAAWRATVGAAEAQTVVLYVARLVPSKNVSLLVDAALALQSHGLDPMFVVVGTGPEQERLRDRIAQAGLTGSFKVIAGGAWERILDAYGGADLFCSTSDYEGFGLAIVEAMAAGLPVVATAVGGVTDLVDPGVTGLLVPAGDAAAVADALTELLNDPAKQRSFGAAGRRRAVEHFDRQAMARSYEDVYRSMSHTLGRPAGQRLAVLKSGRFGDPDEAILPYRIDHLRRCGISLTWTDRHLERRWTASRLRPVLRRLERLGAPVLQLGLARQEIAGANATLAIFESEGHALAALRNVPGPWRRRPLVIVACWLAELLEQRVATGRGVKRYELAYRRVDRLIYFSTNQTEIFQRVLGIEPSILRPVLFGVDHERYSPSTDGGDGGYVLAVGRDRGRDWPTFLEAMRRTGLPTKLVGRSEDLRGLAIPDNVDVLGTVERDHYRELLGRSRVSVVPSVARAYPSGQTVFLESLSMARATVVTSTPAMADYLDDRTCVAVPEADAHAMAGAVTELFEDGDRRHQLGACGRAAVEEKFNALAMWSSIAEILAELEGERVVRGRRPVGARRDG